MAFDGDRSSFNFCRIFYAYIHQRIGHFIYALFGIFAINFGILIAAFAEVYVTLLKIEINTRKKDNG
jgi:hypothetical protein